MERRTIALVDFKRVIRIFFGKAAHQAVSADFGDNGGAGNEDIYTVASGYSFLVFIFWRRF